MSLALDIVTIAAVSAGAFFFLAGTVGLLRFPDALTRLHALTKADNLGLGLVVLGLLPLAGSLRDGLKLVSVWLLVLLAGATGRANFRGLARVRRFDRDVRMLQGESSRSACQLRRHERRRFVARLRAQIRRWKL